MKVKAIRSFIGKVSMDIDEEREIIDKKLAEDLIKAGHVIEVKTIKVENNPIKEIVKEVEKKVEEKTTKKNKNKK